MLLKCEHHHIRLIMNKNKSDKKRPKNPARLDPTRTTMLRRALMGEMRARFRALRKAIIDLVDTQDVFGLRADANAGQGVGLGEGGQVVTTRTISLDAVLNTELVCNVVRRANDGLWYVYSEKGKRLSRGYKSKADAAHRLKQIEYFKHKGNANAAGLITNTRWRFETDDVKLDGYRGWLKDQVKVGVLEVSPGMVKTPWLEPYIKSSYRQGLMRAYTDTHAAGIAAAAKDFEFIEGGKKGFLDMAFNSPVGQSKLRLLSTRAFSQLEGITADMDKEMSRILAQDLAAGKGAAATARDLADTVSALEKKRAMTIARTEVVHAHAEGQLDAFEAMNVEEVGVMAEWNTAHDDDVCPLCRPLEGVILTVKEARGMLPRHPNCRCAWLPANVGEHIGGTTKTTWAGPEQDLEAPGTAPTGATTGQKWNKDEIAARIRDSIRAERPQLSAVVARKMSRWVGADLVTVTGKLKPGSKAWEAAEASKVAAAKAAKAQASAVKVQAVKKAEHSLKVKVGLAKKKYGLTDEMLYTPPNVTTPYISLDGAKVYAKAKGVENFTTDDWLGVVAGAKKAPATIPPLQAQMGLIDDIIEKKAAAVGGLAPKPSPVVSLGGKFVSPEDAKKFSDGSALPGPLYRGQKDPTKFAPGSTAGQAALGDGVYFTEAKEAASNYGEVVEYRARVRKILEVDGDAGFATVYENAKEYGDNLVEKHMADVKAGLVKMDTDYLTSVADPTKRIRTYLEDLGYDGLRYNHILKDDHHNQVLIFRKENLVAVDAKKINTLPKLPPAPDVPVPLHKVAKMTPEEAVKFQDATLAGLNKWKPKVAPPAELLDHANYSHIPGWEAPTGGRTQSYGVVLFDDQGRVLMREPKGHFGGAHWTFAKGDGTKPGSTALAELGEETGHIGEVFNVVPGAFKGSQTKTNYFVGKSKGFDAGLMDTETVGTKWMTFDEAKEAIAMSSNHQVVARDTKLLQAAFEVVQSGDHAAFKEVLASGANELKAVKEGAAKAAHAHKVKLGMAQKHYTKPKFGGGVADGDWVNAATKQKLSADGLNKVLSEKGWHLTTVPTDTAMALLTEADDVVAQKVIIDTLKKAPKGTKVVPLPGAAPRYKKILASDVPAKYKTQSGNYLNLDGVKAYVGDKGMDAVIDDIVKAGSLEEQLNFINAYIERKSVVATVGRHVDADALFKYVHEKFYRAEELDAVLLKELKVELGAIAAKGTYEEQLAAVTEYFGLFGEAPPSTSILSKFVKAKAATPVSAAPAITETIKVPLERDLTKIKDLPGSTRPYLAKDTTGKQWVVKDASGTNIKPEHLRSEGMADELYRRLGFAVPKGKVVESPGGPMKITEYLEGGQTLAEWKVGKTGSEIQAIHEEIRKGFVVDALLANHDVAGLANDNILIVAGKVHRIDNGGALAYRAQGGAKRTWGPKVVELDTMRDAATNANTAAIYKDISDREVEHQIRHVVANRDAVLAAVEDDGVRAVLAARIDNLEARLPATPTAPAARPSTGGRRAVYGNGPEVPKRVRVARSNGVNIAGDREDIEDNNILVWEELGMDNKPVTKLQFKVTYSGSEKIKAALGDELERARATAVHVAPVGAGNTHPEDHYWSKVEAAAKTVSVHARDKKYNMGVLKSLDLAKDGITANLKTAMGNTKEMFLHYKAAIKEIEAAKEAGRALPQGSLTQYVYKPAPEAVAPKLARRDLRVWRNQGINFRTAGFDKGVGKANAGSNSFVTEEAYIIDAGEDISIKFIPNDGQTYETSGRALHGTVSITVPEAVSEEAVNKALVMAKNIGVDTAVPSAAYEEALYLHRGVYINNKHTADSYKAIWESNLTPEEKIPKMKAWIKTNMKVDVDKVPTYDPAGVTRHVDGSGYRHWERWDLPADKIVDEMKGYSLYHSTGGLGDSPDGMVVRALDGILESGGEFTSTAGRIRKGVSVRATGGASHVADIDSGGASYFFTRIYKDGSDTNGFYFRIGALSRQDAVTYTGDRYGRISSLHDRVATIEGYKNASRGTSNETLFKEGLSIDDIDFIRVRTEREALAVLETFKKHGVIALPDGRAVEDIVVVGTKLPKARRLK